MENIFAAVKNNPLFDGIADKDFRQVATCLTIKAVNYGKDRFIIRAGEDVTSIGVIVSGRIRIIKEDERGKVSMMTDLAAPEMYGEILACSGILQSPVTMLAIEDTEVVHIDNKKTLETCTVSCTVHKRILRNLLTHIAKKAFLMNRKIEMLSKHSIRERILCFLDFYGGGEKEFEIPFNREDMAQYLCVDRSALSNELGKMRDEGLIAFSRNRFVVL